MGTKIKLRDILNIQQSYTKLLEQSFLPARTKYNLSKDGKKIFSELEEVAKQKNDLILKYGEKSKDNTMISINPSSPNAQTFQLEYEDLLDVEIDLVTEPLDIELFMRDDCNLSAKDYIILDKFIVEIVKKEEVVI